MPLPIPLPAPVISAVPSFAAKFHLLRDSDRSCHKPAKPKAPALSLKESAGPGLFWILPQLKRRRDGSAESHPQAIIRNIIRVEGR